MLDIVYVLGVIAVFVLVAGIGKAVEKLCSSSSPRLSVRRRSCISWWRS